MKDINSSSDSTSRIIRVIDEIAFHTNLLALNAAIEEPQAGFAEAAGQAETQSLYALVERMRKQLGNAGAAAMQPLAGRQKA